MFGSSSKIVLNKWFALREPRRLPLHLVPCTVGPRNKNGMSPFDLGDFNLVKVENLFGSSIDGKRILGGVAVG
jgi:hypothetical protein